MSATGLLAELRRHGATVYAAGDRLVIDAPAGVVTAELRQALAARKPELLTLLATGLAAEPLTFDPDAGELVAFKLVGTAVGDIWVVADDTAAADHPDILRSGLPLFFFDEVEALRGKTPAELAAIGLVKATFPTSRVLQ